ncbi:DegT/DnrJ/EryC1/StrS family aminotransferase [Flavivirga abyssicola]|uniref:DegT/DnrJ/EryC1/StrS family aminotransferase n=1 Tax=Flavivirga abyssicola TaxID=3063533 RepID=UPI0026DFB283|nr:DegT/DnrJ/EryC1/StrS family aminotransferase [Flavivirga sp. MEBiC07777]WVK12975.1 DegT/DnrJ/EryC1/StrS family aminotransferase [Flavivirga sp. MEBiC07777]
MIYWKGQIINPEDFRVPSYYISPFNVKELSKIDKIKSIPSDHNDMVAKLNSKFGNHEYLVSGKEAMYKALSFYNLDKNDEVYVVTSTGNKYVSSCVTNEIEKYCNWSRKRSDKTKLVFVIHEFGVVYKQMDELKETNLPIIEDLAMSLFSNDSDGKIGTYGDFAIYSLPKFFPIQFGGVLRYNNPKFSDDELGKNELPFQIDLKRTSHFYLKKEKKIIKKRLANYNYYALKLNKIGLNTRFILNSKETPSVFMFTTDSLNLNELKVFMQKNGVECSIFYGENAFYLPVHQNLKKFDLDFIINLIKYFTIENQ